MGIFKIIYQYDICTSYHANTCQLTCLLAHLDDSSSNKYLLNFIQAKGRSMNERVRLIIQFAKVMKDVIKMFVVYVYAMLFSGRPVHTSIMGISIRWKIRKCDIINLLEF